MLIRIYYLLLFLTFLVMIDIGLRVTIEYIPAYHLRMYISNQKNQFNETATKIVSVVEATEKAVNAFSLFFENSFLTSICNTETGRNMLGYLCYFSEEKISLTNCMQKQTNNCFDNILKNISFLSKTKVI